ncbi:MAG TPA: hypothetical protein VLM38_07145 [Blastocatellia bacterium]|nr:hypothetical protein [Blastocatellia bacterium]
MERDREIAKLTNVLRRIARAASHAAWSRDADAARFCVIQYNKVLRRLCELEPAVASLFTVLPDSASAEIIRIAAHELAAYFEDESPGVAGIGIGVTRHGCGGRRAWAGRVRVGTCW